MAKEQRPRMVTKKHLARLERERRQQRYIMTGALVVLVLVIGFIAFGLLDSFVLKPRQPVARIGSDTVSTKEFQTRARYMRLGYLQRYNETVQLAQMFGDDPTSQQYIQSSLAQIQAQLEPTILGQQALDIMVEESLIRQEAERLGITVTREEVDRAMEEAFGFFENGTPTPAPTEVVRPTSTLSPTQLALFPPTPTITPTEEVLSTESVDSTPVSEQEQPTEEPVLEPTATPDANATATPTATPLPTPTAYTRDAFQQRYREVLDSYSQNINFTEADFRDLFEAQLYREKVIEAVVGEIPSQAEHLWARHILVEEADAAFVLYTQLVEGANFAVLAEENSIDGSASRGGDLGWFTYEDMYPDFSAAAFELEIGEISEPVKTEAGWHIIQVLGREERELSASRIEQLKLQRFQEWLDQQRENSDIELYDIWIDRVPTQPSLQGI